MKKKTTKRKVKRYCEICGKKLDSLNLTGYDPYTGKPKYKKVCPGVDFFTYKTTGRVTEVHL